MNKDFETKYGMFGERLLTDKEKEYDEKTGFTTLHGPWLVPEYKKVWDLYFKEQEGIDKYRKECEKEAFELFVKWFHNLWD